MEEEKKLWYIYMECYSPIKKNEIWSFITTWIDLEGTMLK